MLNNFRMKSFILSGVCLLIIHVHTTSQYSCGTLARHKDFNTYKHLLSNSQTCSIYDRDQSEAVKLNRTSKHPKCTADKGCDITLNCHNYTTSNATLSQPLIVQVTPLQLQSILEDPNVTNSCALVMFYAPWCEHSVGFADRFNTVGRMFRELPVMAVDLSNNDP